MVLRLAILAAISLLPLSLFASPHSGPDYAALLWPRAASESDRRTEIVHQLNGSNPQRCAIVGGADEVNCRADAGTAAPVRFTLPKGSQYTFACVKKGECVTIDGDENCGWDWIPGGLCYVSGHYTDSSCSAAKLGFCPF
ncbi:hypothetical protein VTK73DRAFT_501 [Phialemonium thermophilum]|uniref:Uncharacterized protein n=1 Tax=Phialemonium thermophilum TaxID=223376 RepID=A0ABR3VV00_9PEZI